MDLETAARLLDEGRIVAVPTDTVYGVAASLSQPAAVAELFALKRRPATRALPVLVDSVEQIEELGVEWTDDARRLSLALWPGALTVVVAVPRILADLVASTDATAGFRIPDDRQLRTLLRTSGPLAVTSANEHGERPCTDAAEVLSAFQGRDELAGVLDGGRRSGVVSTVVELRGGTWRIVREGAVDGAVVAELLDRP